MGNVGSVPVQWKEWIMRRLFVTCLVVLFLVSLAPSPALSWWEEKQLTFDTDRNHQLDNNLNWSPDCGWIAYDTRASAGGIGNTLTLEKVNIQTKEQIAEPRETVLRW
jgi:hypothetical protein